MVKKNRRIRRDPPKVWINPDVPGVRRPNARAADEPRPDERADGPARSEPEAARRIVAPPAKEQDPRELERARLIERLRAAEGRATISKIVEELRAGGFVLPAADPLVQLQLLEHPDEEVVHEAIGALGALLEREPPQRPTVLASRLRRIEEFAEEERTRAAAAALRRRVKGEGT